MPHGERCYYCGGAPEDRDHIPARVFFPEAKDLAPGEKNYREGLIEVPACRAHNGRYSKDDEFACYTMLVPAFVRASRIAMRHLSTKAARAVARRPALRKAFIRATTPYLRDWKFGIAVHIDEPRLASVMERYARGIYFHMLGGQWEPDLLLVPQGFADERGVDGGLWASLISALQRHFADDFAKIGNHPDVFWFQLAPYQSGYFLHMRFYESVSYYAIPFSLIPLTAQQREKIKQQARNPARYRRMPAWRTVPAYPIWWARRSIDAAREWWNRR